VKRLGWAVLAVGAVAVVAVAAVAQAVWKQGRPNRELAAQLAAIVPPPASASASASVTSGQDCHRPGAPPATVLLVLGQSNAGNHGAEDEAVADGAAPRITLFSGGGCAQSGDPLPGATGRHRSIWTRLPAHLQRLGFKGDLVFVVLAVDATSIDDWSRAGSPLRARLQDLLRDLQAARLQPSRVLWQQGEADARQGTSTEAYVSGFETMLATLRGGGVNAPVLMARSTVCRRGDGRAVREALRRLGERHADVLTGPDTDTLTGDDRPSGCHLSRSGLDAAAALWADAIMRTQP
jgi:hypothetical protein